MKKIILLILLLVSQSSISGQSYLYGVRHNSGNYYFSKYNITNNTCSDLQLITSIGGISSSMSSCTDPFNNVYYLGTGSTILGFNINTGAIVTNFTIPYPGYCNKIVFNSCDTSIYALQNYNSVVNLVRFKPSTNSISVIFSQNYPIGFCGGCNGFINPDNQTYTLDMGSHIIGIDLNNGQILYNSAIVDIPFEQFGHICLDCSSNIIYGTSANVNAGIKYLASIDPVTGLVSHVTGSLGWTSGIFKPMSGGATIDQANDIYYYVGAGNLLIGVNLSSGNLLSLISNFPTLNLIQHFPQCYCTITGSTENEFQNGFEIFPNPVKNFLKINNHGSITKAEIVIYDFRTRKILEQTFFQSANINTTALSEGIYFYEIYVGQKVYARGKIIKN